MANEIRNPETTKKLGLSIWQPVRVFSESYITYAVLLMN